MRKRPQRRRKGRRRRRARGKGHRGGGGGGEEEEGDSAEVNHHTTHKGSGINVLTKSWHPSGLDAFIKNAIQNETLTHPTKFIASNIIQAFYCAP